MYTAGRLSSSYPCLTGDRGGAQLMTIKQDTNREKCDSSEHQAVPLQLNIEPFSISTFQTTVTNLFVYKIEVFSLWHILQRQQQIVHVNSLNSGRMKVCKIRVLVNVGNSTIPNQRLMLKYNPGAAAPFINCPVQIPGSGMNFILVFNQRATIYYSAALFSFKTISLIFFSVNSNRD